MSAGSFVRSRYEATYDADMVHPIRVQPETLALSVTTANGDFTNAATTADITSPISASISRSDRGLGLRPRFVNLELQNGQTPPATYIMGSLTRVPILRNVVFAELQRGTIVTYLGVQWEVVSTNVEDAR